MGNAVIATVTDTGTLTHFHIGTNMAGYLPSDPEAIVCTGDATEACQTLADEMQRTLDDMLSDASDDGLAPSERHAVRNALRVIEWLRKEYDGTAVAAARLSDSDASFTVDGWEHWSHVIDGPSDVCQH